jgi:hypothetical protein
LRCAFCGADHRFHYQTTKHAAQMAAAAASTAATTQYPEGVRRSAPKDLPWGVRRRIARTIGEAFADGAFFLCCLALAAQLRAVDGGLF